AGVSGTAVVVDANGQLGVTVSSARYKRDIAPMGRQSEKVFALHPVTFVYKDDAAGTVQYGLIAEEVAAVYPELVTRTAEGEVQTVRYQELIPMLLNELQREHQARWEERAAVASLRQELAELRPRGVAAGRVASGRSSSPPRFGVMTARRGLARASRARAGVDCHLLVGISFNHGRIAQFGRARPLQGRGRRFETCSAHQ